MNITRHTSFEIIARRGICLATIALSMVTLSAVPIQVHAQSSATNPVPSYTLLEPLPCIPSPAVKDPQGNEIPGSEVTCGTQFQTKIEFRTYVQYMFNLVIALAAATSVFMIVYGGLRYMSIDSWQEKRANLDRIKNAVYGLLLVLASFIILRTIDPRLVAIPSALVPALQIDYAPVAGGLFEQIAADAGKYRRQTDSLAADRIRTNNTIAGLQGDLLELESEKGALLYEEGVSANDPRVTAVNDRILQTKNMIIEQKAVASLKNAQADIVATIHGYVNSRDEKGNIVQASVVDMQKAREAALKFYNDGIAQLTQLEIEHAALNGKLEKEDTYIAKKREIGETYYPIYTDLILAENTILSNTDPTRALANIQQVEVQFISKIINPQVKAESQRRYTQTSAQISNAIKARQEILNRSRGQR